MIKIKGQHYKGWFDISLWNEDLTIVHNVVEATTTKQALQTISYANQENIPYRVLNRWMDRDIPHSQYIAWSCEGLRPADAVLY